MRKLLQERESGACRHALVTPPSACTRRPSVPSSASLMSAFGCASRARQSGRRVPRRRELRKRAEQSRKWLSAVGPWEIALILALPPPRERPRELIVLRFTSRRSVRGPTQPVVPPDTYPNPRNDDAWDNDTVHWLLRQKGGRRWAHGVLFECLRQQPKSDVEEPGARAGRGQPGQTPRCGSAAGLPRQRKHRSPEADRSSCSRVSEQRGRATSSP